MDANTGLTGLLVLLFAASPVVYLLGRISLRVFKAQPAISRWLTFVVLLLAWVPLFFAGRGVLADQAVDFQLGGVGLEMDGVGLLLAVTVLMLVTLVSLYSIHYIAGEENEEKILRHAAGDGRGDDWAGLRA
jgi:NADH:ubiquinone oxidoreductase subunit 5 (subunit L)/multisubunit Na+/H+ antiporter MnhA subunit